MAVREEEAEEDLAVGDVEERFEVSCWDRLIDL